MNADKIAAMFDLFTLLNTAIFARDDDAIIAAIGALTEYAGHSLTLARKLGFIIGYASKESVSYRASVDVVSSYGVNERNYGIMATIDSIGGEFNYLDLKYQFRNFASLAAGSSSARQISYLCFTPLMAPREDFSAFVAASYNISIVDAAIAVLVEREVRPEFESPPIPDVLEEAWRRFSVEASGISEYFDEKSPESDLHAFRSAPAFLELRSFRDLRAALQPIYNLPEARAVEHFDRRYAERYFEQVGGIKDLIPPQAMQFDAFQKRFLPANAGNLGRTAAVVWACESQPDFSGITRENMAALMGRTFEIDRLLSTTVLRRATATADEPFVKLILQTLLRAHSSATRDSYDFKARFQEYIRTYHGGNIVDFMEHVKALNSEIIRYYVVLLDETLLSQMAFLMESSNSIYETRACLLEWFADVTGDQMSAEKAKQLRLDRKIAAVRGVINETRLNIDAVRFRQWIEQNKLTEFSNFIRQASAGLPQLSDLTDKSKQQSMFLSAHREPTVRALQAIVSCYAEFCRNQDYGIASFLGRRIRHGTLRGKLLEAIRDPGSVNIPVTAVTQYQAWSKEYLESIKALELRLHFQDKAGHKNGLISPEIDTTQKWQACLVALSAIFDQAQKDHGTMAIPLIIEQYCWFIFEIELTNLQNVIAEARTKWGLLKLKNPTNDPDVIAFEKASNLAVGDQFNIVASWFRKPPNISPVAEFGHVLDVALQEASGEYATFDPEVSFSGQEDLELSGRIYYNVYDALTIAVRNAAKHGRHPGCLSVGVVVNEQENNKILEITVTNDLKVGDNAALAMKRVADASRAGADGADVVEGLSGFRKLKKMEGERSILSFSTSGDGGTFTVRFSFPFTGILE
jgi:hypothetical protein